VELRPKRDIWCGKKSKVSQSRVGSNYLRCTFVQLRPKRDQARQRVRMFERERGRENRGVKQETFKRNNSEMW
jgi:hypothetical protein